jgi:hypothetical protein
MADSQVKLKFGSTDATAAAFAAINDKLDALGAKAASSTKNIAKGVFSGKALFASVSAIASKAIAAAAELGAIADKAQKMQTSAVYAQQLSGALGQIGINGANLDTVSKAFVQMQKTTGKAGADGFKSVIADLGKIENEQERLIELTKVFGNEIGPGLAPMFAQGPEAFQESLDKVMAGMPAVSDAAAKAGNSLSDAFSTASAHVKTVWQEALGNITIWFENTFGISVEEGMLNLVENVKWAFEVAQEHISVFVENVEKVVAFFTEDWKGALKWVINGFVEFGKAVGTLLSKIGSLIKTVCVELVKSIGRILRGEDADWSGVFDKIKDSAAEVSTSFKKSLDSMVPEAPPGQEWAKVDMNGLKAIRLERLNVVKESLEAKKELAEVAAGAAQGVANTAGKAAKKISDVLKDAKYVGAGSYEALKMALSGAGAGGFAIPGAKNNTQSVATSAKSDNSALLEVAKHIETGIASLVSKLNALEAV